MEIWQGRVHTLPTEIFTEWPLYFTIVQILRIQNSGTERNSRDRFFQNPRKQTQQGCLARLGSHSMLS